MVVTASAPDGGHWMRSATSPVTSKTDARAPWERPLSKAASLPWTIRGGEPCGAGVSTTGSFSP